MREIALDTETTGFDPEKGDRIVEIGCVEMVNRIRTGKVFHCYLNPERDMPEDAFRVHGLSREFLSDKPLFASVADSFIEFIADSPLIIHNAQFDMKFLNAELKWQSRPLIPFERAVDTVTMARSRFPGSPASLDALCKRFEIDLSARTKHGALLDAELLADVYLELLGGRQVSMSLDWGAALPSEAEQALQNQARPRRHFIPTLEELAAHSEFLAKKVKDAMWLKSGEKS